MSVPVSTYRIQFHKGFTLRHLIGIIPYLHGLGVSTVYASPIFKAVPGSTHGYDTLDPHALNPEIGTEADLLEASSLLKQAGMTWLQDIVPNHMAFDLENGWLCDVLEKGLASSYYRCFDINWDDARHPGRVMLPWLTGSLAEAVTQGQIGLQFGEQGLHIRFQDKVLPLDYYRHIGMIGTVLQTWENGASMESELYRQLQQLSGQPPLERQEWKIMKGRFFQTGYQNAEFRRMIQTVITQTNQSAAALEDLLQQQHYAFAPWQETDSHINYRRFFTVNDLICLRMEDPQVFGLYHQYIKYWLDAGVFQGLRVDHIDGLREPEAYLQRLRQLAGNGTYIVVEKILEAHETLPEDWKTDGTTGYDFLSVTNRLFVNDAAAPVLSEFYASIHLYESDYAEIVFRKKLFMLIHHMGGELQNLTDQLAAFFPAVDDGQRTNIRQALAYWLVSFPVYRLYLEGDNLSEPDAEILRQIYGKAVGRAPQFGDTFAMLQPCLAPDPAQATPAILDFLMRTQQFTGPLMAKGVEDTTFYVYNRLISQNEVGDTPDEAENVSIVQFHKAMRQRPPATMNATATHDTKRGEDARMRINIISDFAEEWIGKVSQWREIAAPYFTETAGRTVPDPNDEYFIYQTLIGTYPFDGEPEEERYLERLREYLTKMAREAKVHTNWAKPDADYETALLGFAGNLLADHRFLDAFLPFGAKMARYGVWASLAQVVLKITAPGVPDVYQGIETWDLSMVDPDNRRPVDYGLRQRTLGEIHRFENNADIGLLLDKPLRPHIKTFALHQALLARRTHAAVFAHGEYQPLTADGIFRDKVLAFARRHANEEIITVVPIRTAAVCAAEAVPVGEETWADGVLRLPENARYVNLLTNETIAANPELRLAEVFRTFPAAILRRLP